MAGWYVRRGEKVLGPVEIAKLKEIVAAGRILPTDFLAKDAAGPWKEASGTTLFANEPAEKAEPPPTALVPTLEGDVVDSGQAHLGRSALRVSRAFFATLGRGGVATWSTVSRSLTTRAQRRHELNLAKMQAVPPIVYRAPAPQIIQNTVVHVNQKSGGCGCSGCATLILVLIIAAIALVIVGSLWPEVFKGLQ